MFATATCLFFILRATPDSGLPMHPCLRDFDLNSCLVRVHRSRRVCRRQKGGALRRGFGRHERYGHPDNADLIQKWFRRFPQAPAVRALRVEKTHTELAWPSCWPRQKNRFRRQSRASTAPGAGTTEPGGCGCRGRGGSGGGSRRRGFWPRVLCSPLWQPPKSRMTLKQTALKTERRIDERM